MKKFIYSCLFLAMAAITFSSCEDVPAPYNMPTENESQKVQPSGTGTAADPFNVAGAVKYIEDGGSESELKYVKGKVVSIEKFDESYGSMKYYISDDGTPTNQFYVFNGYAGPNRTKFSGADALKAGDEVVICGNLIVYSGTKEFQTGNYIVSLNGVGGATTPDTPTTGKGSESNPYTVAEAIAAIKAGAPTSEVYVTGIVSDVYYYNDQYKSLSYYISDDGKSKDMQVYSGKGLNGADFTSKNDLKVGQKVTIKGIIKSFNKNGTDIMEVDKNSTIVKIEGEGTGGEVTPKPDTPDTGNGKITFADDHRTLTLENSNATAGESVSFDFTAQNYENQTDMTTIKLSDGTTITFDANGETNGSKYYTSGTAVRVYKNNKNIIKGTKEIAKIIFHCNAPYTKNGETVNCDGNETATINFSGKTATYTNVFTGTTGGGVQLRFSSIEIVYAK
nr:hypothetical protein [uncultured Prevotella sp.]